MAWIANIGDKIVFHKQTHSFATGAISSADALPEFSVYQGTATGAVVSATMVSMGNVGHYQGSFTLNSSTFTTANYCSIRVVAVVSSATAADIIPFFISPTTTARIGTNLVSVSSGAITNLSFTASAIDAAVMADAVQYSSNVSVVSMGNGVIGAATFAAGAIDAAAIADGAIDAAAFASSAIGSSAIANGAITNAKLAIGAIGSSQIAAGAIVNAALATGAIGSSQIAAGAITAAGLASNCIGSSQLAATAVDKISTALVVQPGADPAGVPAATATWMSKLDLIYSRLTSRETFNRTTGVATIYNAATVAIMTFTASDDGTTFTRPKGSS